MFTEPRLIRALCALCVFFLSIPLASAQTWKVGGESVPDSAWARSDGEFGAKLAFTDEPDDLFSSWEVASRGVAFSETSEAIRGAPIVGVIFFTGCGANERGNCEVTVTFTVQGPDGKPWGEAIEGELWVEKPQPGKGQLQLGVGNIGMIIEPPDRLGTYTVKAEIRDMVARKTMVLEKSFTASDVR